MKNIKRPFKFLLSRLLRKTGLCKFFIIDKSVYKLKFHPSSSSTTYWYNPDTQKKDEEFMINYLKRDDVVVDVGANIGTHSLLAASLGCEVYAIEPHPVIFKYLQENVLLNGFDIKLFNLALGNFNAHILLSDKYADEQNRIGNEGVKVRIRRLDDLLDMPIDLLKVDTEGYEKFVFLGGMDTLRRTKCVFFECKEKLFKNYGYGKKDILDILRPLGFKLYKEIPPNLLAVKDIEDFERRLGLV